MIDKLAVAEGHIREGVAVIDDHVLLVLLLIDKVNVSLMYAVLMDMLLKPTISISIYVRI